MTNIWIIAMFFTGEVIATAMGIALARLPRDHITLIIFATMAVELLFAFACYRLALSMGWLS